MHRDPNKIIGNEHPVAGRVETKKVNLAKGLKISIFNQNQWLEMLKSTD